MKTNKETTVKYEYKFVWDDGDTSYSNDEEEYKDSVKTARIINRYLESIGKTPPQPLQVFKFDHVLKEYIKIDCK